MRRYGFTKRRWLFENEQQINLLADMPGVDPGDVKIDLKDGLLTVSGVVQPFEGKDESDVLIEFEIGRYYRQFTLSELVDQNKIEAKLEDGVLRLTLPKAEKAIPRQISVTAG
jgi:HSP20 family molecular chaperone IbpA